MRIKPYEQTTSQSCLPVCLLLLAGIPVDPERETKLLLEGLKAHKESYSLGMVDTFASLYEQSVEMYVDNRPYCQFLQKTVKNKNVEIKPRTISARLLEKAASYILYVDNYFISAKQHVPHFVIVESQTERFFVIIDPWTGKRSRIPKKRLFEAVSSLKKNLKFSPVLIRL